MRWSLELELRHVALAVHGGWSAGSTGANRPSVKNTHSERPQNQISYDACIKIIIRQPCRRDGGDYRPDSLDNSRKMVSLRVRTNSLGEPTSICCGLAVCRLPAKLRLLIGRILRQ
ncbi:hypothetical protein PISMIDRAFT_17248 [Pisolithus microcarpus 441]|uniref:Uncharacterized protein n=1 Tax=Pisolithus microcarpus 441 TaxID=765257 RepID=A0A0C9YWK9_9AGAM|nr:hypothetical protein PISMIDRAFT_17248 [Pisolithus microcarpus 441]